MRHDAEPRWFETIANDERAGNRWHLAPVLLALAVCWLVLGWPWLSGRVTIPWDAKATFMPQIQFLARTLAHGASPAWNPYIFSGFPQIADPQAEIFSPVFLLLAVVTGEPSLRAVDATVLAAVLAGMAALVVWFDMRGWHWAGGLLAALAFGFGAAMAWRLQHTGQVLSMVYLAIALPLLEAALGRRSVGLGLGAGLVAGCMVLGRDQVALVNVYLLAGYVLWRWAASDTPRETAVADLKPLAAGALAGAALIALPVLMTLLLTAESNRPHIDYIGAGHGSLHPGLLLTFWAPDVYGSSGDMERYWGPPSLTWEGTGLYIAQNVGQLYIGAVPALLLMLGLASGVVWAREVRFFTVALMVTLLYALGWYTPVFRLMYAALPGVDLYRRPADAVFEIGFLAAILAGYGAHRLFTFDWPELTRARVFVVAAITTSALAAAIAVGLHFGRLEQAALPLTAAAVAFAGGGAALFAAATIMPLRPALAAVVLAGFTVADLAYSNGPGSATALPPATYDVLQPDTRNETIRVLQEKVAASRSGTRRDRVELAGLGFHWPNASMTHGLENTLGYNPLRWQLYVSATGAGDQIVVGADRDFSKLMPGYRCLLADMLGLRYIASATPIEDIDKTLKAGDLPVVARTADGTIYENPGTLPRVLLVGHAERANFDAILADGLWPSFDPLATVLLDHQPDGEPRDAPGDASSIGSAGIASYGTTKVVVETDARRLGWLVLNDVWHPWWRADVDGAAVPLLRANVLFRAVRVPAGRHRVTFRFTPVRGALAEAWTRLAR